MRLGPDMRGLPSVHGFVASEEHPGRQLEHIAWRRAPVHMDADVNKQIDKLGLVHGDADRLQTQLQPAGAPQLVVLKTLEMKSDDFQFHDELRPLLGKVRNAMVRGVGTVLHLTSAVSGEGVSLVAREIVCAAASMPHCRPLLLDFNQGKVGQSAVFGGNLPGVVGSCMARGVVEVAAVSACGGTFHAAEFDALSFNAFTFHVNDTHAEAISSEETPLLGMAEPSDKPKSMADLYRTLCRTYNLIVVDCPPVQEAPYFVPLSQDTPEVILVVRAESTRISVVMRAKDEIPALGGRLVGVIMNRHRSYIPKFIARRL